MPTYNTSPATDSRALLVLDIDETLLHAATHPLDRPCDYKAERTWVYKRPYLDEFLHYCNHYFQIAIWTSARASFANEIISQLFPYLPLRFVYSQQHCLTRVNSEGQQHCVKPLKQLDSLGFDLRRILVIDDSPEKHCFNPDNLLCVRPYYAQTKDKELYFLKHYLHTIKDKSDLLCLRKQQWRYFPWLCTE